MLKIPDIDEMKIIDPEFLFCIPSRTIRASIIGAFRLISIIDHQSSNGVNSKGRMMLDPAFGTTMSMGQATVLSHPQRPARPQHLRHLRETRELSCQISSARCLRPRRAVPWCAQGGQRLHQPLRKQVLLPCRFLYLFSSTKISRTPISYFQVTLPAPVMKTTLPLIVPAKRVGLTASYTSLCFFGRMPFPTGNSTDLDMQNSYQV